MSRSRFYVQASLGKRNKKYIARDYPDFLQIADVLTERITGAKKVILPDSAHIPPMDQPEVFNKLVLEFLGQSIVRSS
ncbi:alpha/beta fold hydrolase [Brevibacillus sp. DP1.3A]|uniref:alpha/beta fold hydrolase n=1 Tax=Brevibacillus sp. DP1.3A TaxID=2738867 RepID=UPI001D15F48E|nr:alpha/beta hydrolase [Brevibacillus sp. DP1.3A]